MREREEIEIKTGKFNCLIFSYSCPGSMNNQRELRKIIRKRKRVTKNVSHKDRFLERHTCTLYVEIHTNVTREILRDRDLEMKRNGETERERSLGRKGEKNGEIKRERRKVGIVREWEREKETLK